MADKSRAEEILKTIVTFDIEKDFEDEEAKENLVNLFREFIMSDENVVVEVFPKLIDSLSNIMEELGIEKEDEDGENKETEEDKEPEEDVVESKKVNETDILVERANNFIY